MNIQLSRLLTKVLGEGSRTLVFLALFLLFYCENINLVGGPLYPFCASVCGPCCNSLPFFLRHQKNILVYPSVSCMEDDRREYRHPLFLSCIIHHHQPEGVAARFHHMMLHWGAIVLSYTVSLCWSMVRWSNLSWV